MQTEKCKAYFARLGLPFPDVITPDAALLAQIQYAHCTRVPYENLDILRGVPLSLEPDALFEKIVARRRGGYCFEVNCLLGWLLRELGYEVTDYMARYLRGEQTIPMRRHQVLRVVATNGVFLCDVGIGEKAQRLPLRLEESTEQPQCQELYKLEKEPFLGWVLWDYHKNAWRKFYAFTEEPQLPVDFVAPSFYCEKHPDSPFNKQEMFAVKTPDGRITLDGNVLKIFHGDTPQVIVLESDADKEAACQNYFGFSWRN